MMLRIATGVQFGFSSISTSALNRRSIEKKSKLWLRRLLKIVSHFRPWWLKNQSKKNT